MKGTPCIISVKVRHGVLFIIFNFMIECREIWNNNLKVRQSLERGLFQLKFCLMRRMTYEKMLK